MPKYFWDITSGIKATWDIHTGQNTIFTYGRKITNKGKELVELEVQMEAKLLKFTDDFNMKLCSLQLQLEDSKNATNYKLDQVLTTLKQLSTGPIEDSIQGGTGSPSIAMDRGILRTPN